MSNRPADGTIYRPSCGTDFITFESWCCAGELGKPPRAPCGHYVSCYGDGDGCTCKNLSDAFFDESTTPTMDRWVYRDGSPICLDYVPRTQVVATSEVTK